MKALLILAAMSAPLGQGVDPYSTSIYLVADKSISMSQTDPGAARYDALNTFMAVLCAEGPFVTIAEFDDVPTEKLAVQLTEDTLDDVQAQIRQLSPTSGSTNLVAAVREAVRKLMLTAGHRHLIILTDGQVGDSQQRALASMIPELKQAGIRVHVIGLSLPAASGSPLIAMCEQTDGDFCEIMPGNMSAQAREAAIKIALRIARRNLLRFCDAQSDLRVSRTIKRISFILPPDATLITPDGRRIDGDATTPFVRAQQFANWTVATAHAPSSAAPYWEGNWRAVKTATGEPARAYGFLQSGYQLEIEPGPSADECLVHIICQDADRHPPVPIALRTFCQVAGKAATAESVQRLSAPLPERVQVAVAFPKREGSTAVAQLVDLQLDEAIAEARLKREAEEPDSFRFRLFTVDGRRELLDSLRTEDLDEKGGIEVDHSTRLFAAVELCDLPNDAKIQTLDGNLKITDADGKVSQYRFQTTPQPNVFCTQAFDPPEQPRRIRFEAEAELERSQADPLGNQLATASSRHRGSFEVAFRVKPGPPILEVQFPRSLPVTLYEGMIVDVDAEVSASRGTAETRQQLLAAAARELALAVSVPGSKAMAEAVRGVQVVREGPEKVKIHAEVGPLAPGSYNLVVLHRNQVAAQRALEVRAGSWMRTELRRIPRGADKPAAPLSMPPDATVPVVLEGDRIEVTVAATAAFQRRFLDVAKLTGVCRPGGPKPLHAAREGRTWTFAQVAAEPAGAHEMQLTLEIEGVGRFEETMTWRTVVPVVRLTAAPRLPHGVQPPPHTQVPVDVTLAIEPPDLAGLRDEVLSDGALQLVLLDGSCQEVNRSKSVKIGATSTFTLVIDPSRSGQYTLKALLKAGDREWSSEGAPLAIGDDWFSYWLLGQDRSTDPVDELSLMTPAGPLGTFKAGDATQIVLAILPGMPPDYSVGSAEVHLDSHEVASPLLVEDSLGHFRAAGPVLDSPTRLAGYLLVHCIGPEDEVVVRQPLEMDVPVTLPFRRQASRSIFAGLAVLASGGLLLAGLCYGRRPPKDFQLRIESPEGFEGQRVSVEPRGLFRWTTTVGFERCDVVLDSQLREYAGDASGPLMCCHRRLFSSTLIVKTPELPNGAGKPREVDPEVGVSSLQLGENLYVALQRKGQER